MKGQKLTLVQIYAEQKKKVHYLDNSGYIIRVGRIFVRINISEGK